MSFKKEKSLKCLRRIWPFTTEIPKKSRGSTREDIPACMNNFAPTWKIIGSLREKRSKNGGWVDYCVSWVGLLWIVSRLSCKKELCNNIWITGTETFDSFCLKFRVNHSCEFGLVECWILVPFSSIVKWGKIVKRVG